MFTPTHLLVTRSKKTPVQLIPYEQGFKVLTEIEFQRGSEPLFELRNKLGFFCQGIAVVGYALEPMEGISPTAEETATPETVTPETAPSLA
jgi:hypothetical protein